MNILKLFDSKDKKEQLTPEEQRRKESLIANLTEEGKMSDVEKKEREKEVIHSFPNVFSKKDINYLIKIYGLQNTQIIWWAIDNIYWSILDSVDSKDVIHYFDNLSQPQIDLLKNKELTRNFWKLVKQHKTKTNSILTIKRLMKEGNRLMDQYNKEDYGVNWKNQFKQKQEQKRQEYEQIVKGQEEKQKILESLAPSRKSYEEADEKTKDTMIKVRTKKFNDWVYAHTHPNKIMSQNQIKSILSTYGEENMKKLADIITSLYLIMDAKGTEKYEALMNPILSQEELNSFNDDTIKKFIAISQKSETIYPLKTLVKDRKTLYKTLNSN